MSVAAMCFFINIAFGSQYDCYLTPDIRASREAPRVSGVQYLLDLGFEP